MAPAVSSKHHYVPRRTSRSAFVDVRGLRCHVRMWGEPTARPLVLLHGGRDASATFQFLVDAFAEEWLVVAPDWRGHGLSGWAPNGYSFADYLGDLDALLDHFFAGRAVPLVGHSLGGNVACVYAGLRPARVLHLVSLDGFGLPDRRPEEAPMHLRRWLNAWRSPPTEKPYPSVEAMAERLRVANPRLDADRAYFLAENLSRPAAAGGFTWCFDPLHRAPFASLHRVAEWQACLREITAPALWLGSGAVFPPSLEREPGGFERRLEWIPDLRFTRIENTGHNLHHDVPAAVAAGIERFLSETPGARSGNVP